MVLLPLFRYLLRRWRALRASAGRDGPRRSAPARSPGRLAAGARAGGRREPRASAAARGPLALVAHQVRYDLLASFRNPRARFFTFIFPVVLLVILAGVFGSGHTVILGVRVKLARFYVPGILAMSIIAAAYT